jgi:hypothetical protein
LASNPNSRLHKPNSLILTGYHQKLNGDIMGSICITDLKPMALDVVFYAPQNIAIQTKFVAQSPNTLKVTKKPKYDLQKKHSVGFFGSN